MIERLTSFILIIIAVGTVSIVGFYLIQSVQNNQNKELPTRITYGKEAYRSAYGSLKYAEGKCDTTDECAPAGCSSEMCSSDSELTSACVVADDFPDTDIYECGCFDNRCAWIKK